MRKSTKLLLALLVIVAAFTLGSEIPVYAAKAKLSKKTVTLEVGKKAKIKVTGTTKKVTWSSSDKKIAKVSSKGKITAISKGTCKITAKVGSKKLTCTVTVQEAPIKTEKNDPIKDTGPLPANEFVVESHRLPMHTYTRNNLPGQFSSEEELVEWLMDRQYNLYMKPVIIDKYGYSLIGDKKLVNRIKYSDWDSFWFEYVFEKDNIKANAVVGLQGAQYIDSLNAAEFIVVITLEFQESGKTRYTYDGKVYAWPEEGFDIFFKYFG